MFKSLIQVFIKKILKIPKRKYEGVELIPFRKKNLMGFSTKNEKKIIIKCKYLSAKPFIKHLAPVKIKDKFGFINTFGNLVIDYKYDFIENFH